MADTLKTCRTCKRAQPISHFVHRLYPTRPVATCIDCRTRTPVSAPLLVPSGVPALPVPVATAPQPLGPTESSGVAVDAAPSSLSNPAHSAPSPTPALPAPLVAVPTPAPAFVTGDQLDSRLGHLESRLETGLGALRQFVQDELTTLVTSLRAPTHSAPPPPPPTTPDAASSLPALPARSGECQSSVLYPWLSAELVDRVHNDALSPYDLPKLGSPSWIGTSTDTDAGATIIDGHTVSRAPTASSSNRQFLKAVPNFSVFGRLWVVYASIRASSSADRDLPIGLGRFYQRVADLQDRFPWDRVVDYVIAICTLNFGKGTAADWARFETEIHATHFQGLTARPTGPATAVSGAKRPAPRADDPRREQICHSWNSGKCAGTDQRPCFRRHVCNACGGAHQSRSCQRMAPANAGPSKAVKQD